jgi:cholesterol transport system auxiliary component
VGVGREKLARFLPGLLHPTKDSGYAHIEVFVKLMDDTNGRIVATRTITGDAAVAANTPDDVVAGLDAALSQVLIELVRWTLGVI